MDFAVVIRRWLLEQPDEVQQMLQSLIDSYLEKGSYFLYVKFYVFIQTCLFVSLFCLAVEWISKNGEAVVPVSTLTTIRSILSHLVSCNSKMQFINGLLKGGGANLTPQSRTAFGQTVLDDDAMRAQFLLFFFA